MNRKLLKTIRELMIFASPIAFGQLSQMLIGMGDVFIAAHYNRDTLAAMGIANGISAPIFLIGLGLLLGISPTLSKKRGESLDVSQYFYTCIVYAIIIGFVFMSIAMSAVWLVPYLGFNASLTPLIQQYLFLISFSYLGSYIFIAIKEYLQAIEHVFFANSISVVAVLVNLALGYMMAFGVFVFPELGIKGLGFAAIIIRWATGITIFIYAIKFNKTNFSVIRHFAKHVFTFSIPISLSIFTEVLAFSVVMILIGKLGPLYAAIHSISLNLASTTYMIPLAISSAVSVKVAYFYGRRNFGRVKDFMKAGILLSTSFMAVMGLIMFFMPKTLLGFFTSDQEIIMVGSSIIIVCALFQIFDGAQVTISGILRGLGITKPTFIIALAGYWVVGLPLGYYLGYVLKMNALGFWIGLAFALLIVALSLASYLLVVLRRNKKLLT